MIPAILAGLGASLFGNVANTVRYNNMKQYNSPSAQAKRFAKAGFSPNAMFTNADSGNINQVTEWQAPDLTGMIADVSAAKASRSQAHLSDVQSELAEFELGVQKGLYPQTPAGRKFEEDIKRIGAQALESGASAVLKTEQTDLTKAQTQHEGAKQELTEAQTGLVGEEIITQQTIQDLNRMKGAEIAENIKKIQQEVSNLEAEEQYTKALTTLTGVNIDQAKEALAQYKALRPYEISEVAARTNKLISSKMVDFANYARTHGPDKSMSEAEFFEQMTDGQITTDDLMQLVTIYALLKSGK